MTGERQAGVLHPRWDLVHVHQVVAGALVERLGAEHRRLELGPVDAAAVCILRDELTDDPHDVMLLRQPRRGLTGG